MFILTIIILGGTAGLTVASRLTENSSISVLVLEAGHSDSIDFNVSSVLNKKNLSINTFIYVSSVYQVLT